jgi:hypothetical protein
MESKIGLRVRAIVFNATFNNISVISRQFKNRKLKPKFMLHLLDRIVF